jgi:ubiquinone/menaquinone biosynthesis C-methylase UbiE
MRLDEAASLSERTPLSLGTDRNYLLTEQYKDASNLNARIALHARFSTHPLGWHRWVFDQLELPPQARLLEIGGGSGRLWAENADRLPAGWRITLTDLSPGMLAEARANLQTLSRFACEQADAQALPFADARFDAVLANHMLYHIPDKPKAFAEVRRVLKPGGRLYAATNGSGHMRELNELLASVGVQGDSGVSSVTFRLDNGAEQIAPWFDNIVLRRCEDELRVTEAEPLVAYLLSCRIGPQLAGEKLETFVSRIERHIAQRGAFHITKETGLFIAR